MQLSERLHWGGDGRAECFSQMEISQLFIKAVRRAFQAKSTILTEALYKRNGCENEEVVSGEREVKRKGWTERHMNIKLTGLLVDSSMPYFQNYLLHFKQSITKRKPRRKYGLDCVNHSPRES